MPKVQLYTNVLKEEHKKMEFPGAHSHWRCNTVSAPLLTAADCLVVSSHAPIHARKLTADHWSTLSPWRGQQAGGVWSYGNVPNVWSCVCVCAFVCVYLRVWLLVVERRYEAAGIYGALAGPETAASGWWMEATPDDLNLGRWRPNLFSTPAKVAAARR